MDTQTKSPTAPFIRHPINGDTVMISSLPKSMGRWTYSRKAVLVLAVQRGVISLEGALARYSLSVQEFSRFCELLEKHGIGGLRATRTEEYPLERKQVLSDMPWPEVLRVGAFALNRTKGELRVDGRTAYLTQKELSIVALLMVRTGEVVDREAIFVHLYDDLGRSRPHKKTLEVYMSKIRKKLRDIGVSSCIGNVWGRGYQFVKPA